MNSLNKITYNLKTKFDIKPLKDALDANPHLWDANTMRTENANSPHHGLSDIWARFAIKDQEAARSGPHTSDWYDTVTDCIPIKELAQEVMKEFPGKLGGVLITRIRPGQLCKPHIDHGWHARYYDKIAVMIQANDKQAFCFDETFVVSKPGDAFWFDNSYSHWVPNVSNEDRITAIFCIRPQSKGE